MELSCDQWGLTIGQLGSGGQSRFAGDHCGLTDGERDSQGVSGTYRWLLGIPGGQRGSC